MRSSATRKVLFLTEVVPSTGRQGLGLNSRQESMGGWLVFCAVNVGCGPGLAYTLFQLEMVTSAPYAIGLDK
jgi:hypothetical protein